MTTSPLILAHRGASDAAPENTIAAFALAIELGSDGVELDVHRTSDGELVVHHDAQLAGIGLVADHPLAELRSVHPDVPTLAEVLDVCADLRLINVELKCCSWDDDPDPDRVVARGVAALIARRSVYHQVVVSSFDLPMIDDLRKIDDRIATGWLIQGVDPSPLVAVAKRHGHAWLHPDWGNLQLRLAAVMEASSEHNVSIDSWTIDDPAVMREFSEAGVHALITNKPEVAVAALRTQ